MWWPIRSSSASSKASTSVSRVAGRQHSLSSGRSQTFGRRSLDHPGGRTGPPGQLDDRDHGGPSDVEHVCCACRRARARDRRRTRSAGCRRARGRSERGQHPRHARRRGRRASGSRGRAPQHPALHQHRQRQLVVAVRGSPHSRLRARHHRAGQATAAPAPRRPPRSTHPEAARSRSGRRARSMPGSSRAATGSRPRPTRARRRAAAGAARRARSRAPSARRPAPTARARSRAPGGWRRAGRPRSQAAVATPSASASTVCARAIERRAPNHE